MYVILFSEILLFLYYSRWVLLSTLSTWQEFHPGKDLRWFVTRGHVMKGLPRWLNQMWLNPWVGKIPWSRKQQPIPVFLFGKSHGERGLTGYRINRVGNDLATKQQHVVKASQHSSEHNQNLLLTCEFMCANSSHF